MNLRKHALAVLAAVSFCWPVAANADEPNYEAAQFMYFQILGEIHNHCVLLWTYDPNPYSNYGNCVHEQKYGWAIIMQVSAAANMGYYYPDGTSVGMTYYLVYQALYYE